MESITWKYGGTHCFFFLWLLHIISLEGSITPIIQATDSQKTHGNHKVEMCQLKEV